MVEHIPILQGYHYFIVYPFYLNWTSVFNVALCCTSSINVGKDLFFTLTLLESSGLSPLCCKENVVSDVPIVDVSDKRDEKDESENRNEPEGVKYTLFDGYYI